MLRSALLASLILEAHCRIQSMHTSEIMRWKRAMSALAIIVLVLAEYVDMKQSPSLLVRRLLFFLLLTGKLDCGCLNVV